MKPTMLQTLTMAQSTRDFSYVLAVAAPLKGFSAPPHFCPCEKLLPAETHFRIKAHTPNFHVSSTTAWVPKKAPQ